MIKAEEEENNDHSDDKPTRKHHGHHHHHKNHERELRAENRPINVEDPNKETGGVPSTKGIQANKSGGNITFSGVNDQHIHPLLYKTHRSGVRPSEDIQENEPKKKKETPPRTSNEKPGAAPQKTFAFKVKPKKISFDKPRQTSSETDKPRTTPPEFQKHHKKSADKPKKASSDSGKPQQIAFVKLDKLQQTSPPTKPQKAYSEEAPKHQKGRPEPRKPRRTSNEESPKHPEPLLNSQKTSPEPPKPQRVSPEEHPKHQSTPELLKPQRTSPKPPEEPPPNPQKSSPEPPKPKGVKANRSNENLAENQNGLILSRRPPQKPPLEKNVETLYKREKSVKFGTSESHKHLSLISRKGSKVREEQLLRVKKKRRSKTPSQVNDEIKTIMRSKSKNIPESEVQPDGEEAKDENKEEERPEYASNPREFTKSGTPIPFWQLEMRKGPEYLFLLHRHYGKRMKHERFPVYKPDLDLLSINTQDSNTEFDDNYEDIYHQALKHLIPLDRVFLFHRLEITKGVFFSKTVDDYHVLNHHGHILYRVKEEPRKKCGPLVYTFCDYYGEGFMQLVKAGRMRFEVFCPPGTPVAFIAPPKCRCICQPPKVNIYDKNKTELIQFAKLKQKVAVGASKDRDYIFEYQSVRAQGPLGMITKKLADLKMSNFTEHDYYGLKLHLELSPNIKASVMAAWFLIYLKYYNGKTHRETYRNLTKAARKLYEGVKPSTQTLPPTTMGAIVFDNREDEEQ